ncbi:MAG: aldo/keto reductase [Arcanobacterium sp.]|nr:aldo/keto reductase [Arcanobacterium sp.]
MQITLNTGAQMPQLGFGTYKVDPKDTVEVVLQALELGYRHIDTAQMYQNEAEVGIALKESGIPREEIFLTTKLNNSNHLAEDARRSFAQSLEKLGVDYVDLFLMHWPLPTLYGGDYVGTYKVMEEFALDRRARAIGVSNFEPHHLVNILRECAIKPANNQIERHPFLSNTAAVEFCRNQEISVTAWSPLARGNVFGDETLAQIAAKHEATLSQVALAWQLQAGICVIPKASTKDRQLENLQATQLVLDAEDIAIIDSLNKGEYGRTGTHPDEMDRIPN